MIIVSVFSHMDFPESADILEKSESPIPVMASFMVCLSIVRCMESVLVSAVSR